MPAQPRAEAGHVRQRGTLARHAFGALALDFFQHQPASVKAIAGCFATISIVPGSPGGPLTGTPARWRSRCPRYSTKAPGKGL